MTLGRSIFDAGLRHCGVAESADSCRHQPSAKPHHRTMERLMTVRIGRTPDRRRFLASAAATTALTAIGGLAKPHLSRAADRPLITHGLQSTRLEPKMV
jgi:hypothetical protein